jgi:hypothetical protein
MVWKAVLKHINPVKYIVHFMQIVYKNMDSKIIQKYKVSAT